MQWKIHGERPIYENPWVNVWLVDVEQPGETAAEAAAREVLEETGWRTGEMAPLIYAQPANGITDSEHFVFRADAVEYTGPPTELNESDRLEWIPLSELRGMIDRREIVSSGSLVGVLYLLLDEAGL